MLGINQSNQRFHLYFVAAV